MSNCVFFIDEGVIYEEGTPEEIFDDPKQDKTRQFIRNLKVFEAKIGRTRSDCPDLITGIEQFGFRHMISRKLVYRMVTIADELCVRTILPQMKAGEEINLTFEYSEADGGSIAVEIIYPGADSDPLKRADQLSLKLIRNACPDISRQYSGGCCILKGNIAVLEA